MPTMTQCPQGPQCPQSIGAMLPSMQTSIPDDDAFKPLTPFVLPWQIRQIGHVLTWRMYGVLYCIVHTCTPYKYEQICMQPCKADWYVPNTYDSPLFRILRSSIGPGSNIQISLFLNSMHISLTLLQQNPVSILSLCRDPNSLLCN